MKRVLLAIAALLCCGIAVAQVSQECVRGRHNYKNMVFLATGSTLSGTWTCASGSEDCAEVGQDCSGTCADSLSPGDIIVIDSNSYEVKSVTDANNFAREEDLAVSCSNAEARQDDLIAHTAATVYYNMNAGAHATAEYAFQDGANNTLPLELSQDGVGSRLDVADAEFVGLNIVNADEPDDTDTGQSASLTFSLFGSTDNGSTFAEHVGAKIATYKAADAVNTTEADHDFGLDFYVTNAGTTALAWRIQNDGDLEDVNRDIRITGDGVTLNSAGRLVWSSTGVYYGASDLFLSRYDDGETSLEGDDESGTPGDGVGTLRLIIGGGDSTNYGLNLGGAGLYGSQDNLQIVSGRVRLYQGSDLGSSNAIFLQQKDTTIEMTSSNAQQAFLYVKGEFAQSGSAAADLIEADAILSSLGDGSTGDGNNLLNLKANSTSVFRVDTDGDVYPATVINNVGTLGDTDTTPDVSGANVWWSQANTGATEITDLDSPLVGAEYTICVGSSTNPPTITDGGNFTLAGNWSPGLGDCIKILVKADNDYYQTGGSDN